LVGWCGLLVPSLIRSIEATYDRSDAEFGVYYLAVGLAYAAGSFGGGLITERAGRRPVLGFASWLLAAGLVALAIAPSWAVVLLAAIPIGLGLGALDGGANGLFLDVFRSNRGRALNLLHLCFSLGALSAPLVLGPLVEAGVPWQAVLFVTGVPVSGLGALLFLTRMPDGRHVGGDSGRAFGPEAPGSGRARIPRPLGLLCLAIGFYIASEVGVTDWLVRFLEPAPLSLATSALALYWAGMAAGRLGSARVVDRFDHVRYATAAAVIMSIALAAAVLVPSLPVSIGFFALAGLAAGPVAPMIMVVGGDRYPDRSAAVGGYVTTASVVGGIGFPTLMGFLSVTVGLTVAMLGTVILGLASAVALVLAGRAREGLPVVADGLSLTE
ncbi:MAG TPA: MFS transporter, partial [Candidatus Limnocylindrales bacterium]